MTAELDARAAGARRLNDKVCIVTGAGQGIGRATAKRLGQEGGKIIVADRVEASATKTVKELRENDVDASHVLADVSTFAGAQELIQTAQTTFDASMCSLTMSAARSGSSPFTFTPKKKSNSNSNAHSIQRFGAASQSCL